ncbi:MAG: efflux RND transporter periplasmic adaptor subunit [Planctomycetota bacterium]
MKNLTWMQSLAGPLLAATAIAGAWFYRDVLFSRTASSDQVSPRAASHGSEWNVLKLGSQARKNLELSVKRARPTSYWRTITIPGEIQDRPGVSDRGVTSPAVGSIAEIHVYPGDTVLPGEPLVTIALFSEYLQATQTQLFQASQEILLLQKEIDRLSAVANSGGIAGSRLIQIKDDIQRQSTLTKSAKQELLNRGLSPNQVDDVVQGKFVSTIEVVAPPLRSVAGIEKQAHQRIALLASHATDSDARRTGEYEVQSLAVELGQTVQAGQLIAGLANHQHLYIVGHAFKHESSLLEQAAQNGREVQVDFSSEETDSWAPLEQSFQIRHLSNSIDEESRTFDFFIPLQNQSRSYERSGETFLVWRFRPGQRTRIRVPVESLDDVFVLPSEAVARAGPEAFVYRQNGDLFDQIAVNILYEDRNSVVIANDGSIAVGSFLAQNAGASLRRVLKSQATSGERPGLHVHADGTVHAAH